MRSTSQAKRHVRTGISWPLQADGKGYFAPCKDEAEDIRQSVRHCLFVGPREQLMRMDGCDLASEVWEEVDEVFTSMVRLQVRRSLRQEPRILLEDVLVTREEVDKGMRVYIEVLYRRRGSKATERVSTSATYTR